MNAPSRRTWALVVAGCLLVTAATSAVVLRVRARYLGPPVLSLEPNEFTLAADGATTMRITVTRSDERPVDPKDLRIVWETGKDHARVKFVHEKWDQKDDVDDDEGYGVEGTEARLTPGVLPGEVKFKVVAPGMAPQEVVAHLQPALGDRFRDGTPDFLRLDSPTDREAFRRWFSEIAEYQALRPPAELPGEIDDCAALIRYSYRNALRPHDAAWLKETGLAGVAGGGIEKYAYPYTPLGASLFRVKSGDFRADDLRNGDFAEFADAATLRGFNTYFVSRDVRQARAGDLLFYRQLEQHTPFHSMVFIGRSRLADAGDDVIVYHTGPIDGRAGEMRRTTVAGLLKHPEPRWRPLPGNTNFLGVYRWNILRESY
jgi:uncharacterized protein YfaT (DUF1175 family)